MLAAMLTHASQDQNHAGCPRCRWQAPDATRVVPVATVGELHLAVAAAQPGDTILLADGRYALQRGLEIGVPGVTLRSQSGNPDRVLLHGRGMDGDHVGVAIGVSAT